MNSKEHDVNSCTVFVSSSDAYADIWPAFFALFKREWPSFRGVIYLNTEQSDFEFDGLRIICTKVGKRRGFGETLKAGLDRICDGDVILLLMIDYFFEGKVDVEKLAKLHCCFRKENVDVLYLMPDKAVSEAMLAKDSRPYGHVRKLDIPRFSFQAAFWKRSSLKKLVVNWEDPWHTEFYAQLRMRFMRPFPNIWMYQTVPLPIPYDPAGSLHGGGKWLMPVLDRIDMRGIDIDLSKRAIYKYDSHENARIVWHDIKPCVSNLYSAFSVFCAAVKSVFWRWSC